jgi:hypothetical protein
MKKFACLALAACALASPVLAFAQSATGPLTRAQVRAELIELERAGYRPSTADDATYPEDIQAAEAKVASQDARQPALQAVGGAAQQGASQSGAHAAAPSRNLYFGE